MQAIQKNGRLQIVFSKVDLAQHPVMALIGPYLKSESYFSDCPRDELGHCKPSGQGDDAPAGGSEARAIEFDDAELESAIVGFYEDMVDYRDFVDREIMDLADELDEATTPEEGDDENTFDEDAVNATMAKLDVDLEDFLFNAGGLADNLYEKTVDSVWETNWVEDPAFEEHFIAAREDYDAAFESAKEKLLDSFQSMHDDVDDYRITLTTINDDDKEAMRSAVNMASDKMIDATDAFDKEIRTALAEFVWQVESFESEPEEPETKSIRKEGPPKPKPGGMPKPPKEPSGPKPHQGEPCEPGWTVEGTGCVPVKPGDGGGEGTASENQNPQQQQGPGQQETPQSAAGKVANYGKQVLEGAVALEHGAKDFIVRQVEKLPESIQTPVAAVFKVAYASYIGAQKAVDAVAEEKGLNDQQRKTLAAVTASADAVLGMKVLPALMAATGVGTVGAMASSFVPVASLSYLAYSSVTNPAAVVRAARKLVKEAISKKEPQGPKEPPARQAHRQNQNQQRRKPKESQPKEELTAKLWRHWITKGSYFEDCPRDAAGHCKPKGEADESGGSKEGADEQASTEQEQGEFVSAANLENGQHIEGLFAFPGLGEQDFAGTVTARLHDAIVIQLDKPIKVGGALFKNEIAIPIDEHGEFANGSQLYGPEGKPKAKPKPPPAVPALTQRQIIRNALEPHLGAMADKLATDLGLSLNRYSLHGRIKERLLEKTPPHSGMYDIDAIEEKAKALTKEVTAKVVAFLKENGIPLPAEIAADKTGQPEETEEQRAARYQKEHEAWKEKRRKHIKDAKMFAEAHWKDKKMTAEKVPNQDTWIAMRTRQEMAKVEKDHAKIAKLAELQDKMLDRDNPNRYEDGEAFKAEFARPYVKPLLNRYKYSSESKGNQTVSGALDVSHDRLLYFQESWPQDTSLHEYSDWGSKAVVEYKEALKKAFMDPDYTPPTPEVLESVMYESWLPQKWRDLETTNAMKRSYQEYLEKEYPYGEGHLNAALKVAMPKVEALLKKVGSPDELLKKLDKVTEAAQEAGNTFSMLTKARDDFERQYRKAMADFGFSEEFGGDMTFILDVPKDKRPVYEALLSDQRKAKENMMAKVAEMTKASEAINTEWVLNLLPYRQGKMMENLSANIPEAPYLSPNAKRNLERANEFLSKAVGVAWGDLHVHLQQLPDGHYRSNQSNATIRTPVDVGSATLVHEFGHLIEEQNGSTLGTLSKAFAFQQIRLRAQTPEQLGSEYEPREIGAKDGFISAYTGKYYPQDASEVLSMGIQSLYENPIDFYKHSPEHFKYTLACLHGWLTQS